MKAIFAVLLICTSQIASAELPCFGVTAELFEGLGSNLPLAVQPLFLECIKQHRICLIGDSGNVIHAEAVRELIQDKTVWGGIIQSPANEQRQVCLLGSYSGGSAAAWLFDGWSFIDGKMAERLNLNRGDLNSDAVNPRELGNAIYNAYKARSSR